MPQYIIYFNQQWVGEHTSEWFASRGPLALAVLEEMKAEGVFVFGGGLVEDGEDIFGTDEYGKPVSLISTDSEFLGGLTIIDVESDEDAKFWGEKVAEACGWPQVIRRFK